MSESTARKHLERLAAGIAAVEESGRTRRYARDDDRLLLDRVGRLQRTHSRDELLSTVAELRRDLATYRERHGVESPEELAVELEVDSDEPWSQVTEWEAMRARLAVVRTALSFKRARELADA